MLTDFRPRRYEFFLYFEQISALFAETSGNEKEHAKLWFKLLHNGEVPTTIENLQDAANGENYEWTDMYDRFAKEAEEELKKKYNLKGVKRL